ncbi:MAG: type II secretion system F family protein [Verrucomicrobiota bacterium]
MRSLLPEWLRQIAQFISAGVPLAPALRSLSPHLGQPLQKANQTVSDYLAEGGTLSEAMQAVEIPLRKSDFVAMDMAHEGGRLDQCLTEIASWMEKDRAWARQTTSVLIYPLVVIHLAALLPFLPLWLNHGFLIAIGFTLITLTPPYAAASLIFILRKKMNSGRSHSLSEKILHLPWIGQSLHFRATARFCGTFRSGLLSGARMDDCLIVAAQASGQSWFEHRISEQAQQMTTGATLSEIVNQAEVFPQVAASLLVTGDQSGSLDEMALTAQRQSEELADHYHDLSRKAVLAVSYIWAVFLVLVAIASIIGPYYYTLYQLLDN